MAGKPTVVFPLYEGSTLLDFAGATQIFASAGFTPVWAAACSDPITTTEKVQVLPGDTFDGVRQKEAVEILIVPGGGPKVGEAGEVGYPRWVIYGNRFSRGGVSSSIDLALELVKVVSGPTRSMHT